MENIELIIDQDQDQDQQPVDQQPDQKKTKKIPKKKEQNVDSNPILQNISIQNEPAQKKTKKIKEPVAECTICAEPYNKSTRVPVQCEYCKFESCRTCCRTFILNEPVPRCMNNSCGREWTRNFLRHTFTNTFIQKDLRDHRKDILFEQEKSLMPATQPAVEREIRYEKINEEIGELQQQIFALQTKVTALCSEKYSLINNRHKPEMVRAEFVRACPDPECRGYLSTKWKCGLCDKWTCNQCHEIKGLDHNAEHVCNPDNVASAELVARETRPCPNCKAGIFKIEGCNQMFCTKCNTPFDWRTGRVITGIIHNPHYFEWRNQRNANENANPNENYHPCGNNEMHHRFIDNLVRTMRRKRFVDHPNINDRFITSLKLTPEYKIFENNISSICRRLIHINYVVLPPLNINMHQVNQRYRILYMMNRMSEEEFKTKIQCGDKRNSKTAELSNVFTMVYNSGCDIMARLSNFVSTTDDKMLETNPEILAFVKEIEELSKYANTCLDEIAFTYNSTSWMNLKEDLDVFSKK